MNKPRYLRALTPPEGVKVKCIIAKDGEYFKEDTPYDFTIQGSIWIKILVDKSGQPI